MDSPNSLNDVLEDENGKNVTYQQYLKFLENENRGIDPGKIPPDMIPPEFFMQQNEQLGEES
jgi:hypothetical protein